MKLNQEKVRKVVIVLMGILLTILIYQAMWGENSVLGEGFTVEKKAERQLADGFWGELGFYKDPSDNVITYILLGVVLVSIVYQMYSRFVNKPRSKRKK